MPESLFFLFGTAAFAKFLRTLLKEHLKEYLRTAPPTKVLDQGVAFG